MFASSIAPVRNTLELSVVLVTWFFIFSSCDLISGTKQRQLFNMPSQLSRTLRGFLSFHEIFSVFLQFYHARQVELFEDHFHLRDREIQSILLSEFIFELADPSSECFAAHAIQCGQFFNHVRLYLDEFSFFVFHV